MALIAQQKLNIQKKKNAKLSNKIKQLERKIMDFFDSIKNNGKTLNFLIGILNVQLFKWLLSLIRPNAELASKSITYENHLLIVLMELKHRLLKRKIWHRCFPLNLKKFLKAPFLLNTSGQLLLDKKIIFLF